MMLWIRRQEHSRIRAGAEKADSGHSGSNPEHEDPSAVSWETFTLRIAPQ
jgi:hypothetical protein